MSEHIINFLIVSVLDVCIAYFMTNNLCGFNLSSAIKKIKAIPFLPIIILYPLIAVTFSITLSLSAYNLFFPLSILLLILLFVDKKSINLTFDEIIVIWILIKIIITSLLLLLTSAVSLLTANSWLLTYGVYILTLLSVLIICQLIDFNRLLILTLKNIFMRFAVIAISILMVVFSLMQDNIYSTANNSIIIALFLIPIIIGIVYTAKRVHESTRIIPEAYHDAKKLLMLLSIKAEESAGFEELRDILRETVELMDLNKYIAVDSKSTAEISLLKELIDKSVEVFKQESKTNIAIDVDVIYEGKYAEVCEMKLSYILNLMLCIPVESLTSLPVKIEVTSSEQMAEIRMSCHYKFERRFNSLYNFITDQNTDQNPASEIKINKHYSLSKLRDLILDHQGEVSIFQNNEINPKRGYVTILIKFSRRSDAHG